MSKPARATFRDSGGFVLRTPLLPFATLAEVGEGGTARAAWESGGDVRAAVAADRAALTERLQALVRDPGVREAIFVASPDLEAGLDRWLAGEDKDPDSTVRSVLSYLTRMCARPTPFGLFAGVSTGEVGTDPSYAVPPRSEVSRKTRLDYGFLAKLVNTLQADPRAQRALTFVPNTSLYRAGARLRMAEARIDERGVRYHRVTFEEDEALAAVLERARGGARLAEIAGILVDDDITREEAEEYVGEILTSQLLVSDLGPAITGPSPVPGMVEALAAHEETAEIATSLAEAEAELAALDAARLGNDPARYRDLADRLRKVDPDLRLARLFQVDLAKPAPALRLGAAVVDECYRAIDLLHPMMRFGDDDLARFRSAFNERYEHREVPLAEALDEEIGVGFGGSPSVAAEGAPLLAGLAVAPGESGGSQWHDTDHLRLRLVYRALQEGTTSVELTDRDVEGLTVRSTKPLPDAMSITASVAAESEAAVAAGDFQVVLHSVSGPSGVRLLGRFCHLEPELESLVRRHVEDEESLRPDVIFAEIVHLPEGRVGNVLARPVLRAHEIPFLGKSGAPDDGLITLDDLMVSVVGDRIVLRSKRLGKEVVPRLSNAHNFQAAALAPYRFLAAIQGQGVAQAAMWSWGPLGSAPFLPRVTRGRLVVSKAQWTLSGDDTKAVRDAKNPADRFRAVQEMRERLRLPRWVVVQVGDNTLPVDLDATGGCDLFAHEVRQRGGVRLTELLPEPDRLACASPEGRYTNEFVLPIVRRVPSATYYSAMPTAPLQVYAPGSEWLTAKLYGGRGTADLVLREVVTPLVMGAGLEWFFIRYADPDPHLRLRVRGEPDQLLGAILPRLRQLSEPLLADGRLWRLQLDTYKPEVERYGGPDTIRMAERVFHADSEAVLAVLLRAQGDEGLDARWRAAMHGVDLLLADLGFELDARKAAVRSWRDGLASEHGGTGENAKRWAGQLFRRERAALAAQPVPDAFLRRSETVREVGAQLREMAAAGRLMRPLESIAGSFTHMHVNRILRAAQRTQELVVYDLLDRVYAARRAREGASS